MTPVTTEPVLDAHGAPSAATGLRRSSLFAVLGLVMLVGTASVVAGIFVPFISPALGLACALGVPTVLLFGALGGLDPVERLGVSVMLSVLALMAAGLMVNTVLPHLGARGPLGEVGVLLTTTVLCAALGIATWHRHPPRYRSCRTRLGTLDWRLGVLSAALVPMAAVGAVRLNNGLGGGVTLGALRSTSVN